jgi:hypothetical protein
MDGIQKIEESGEHNSGGETLTKSSGSAVLKEGVGVASPEETAAKADEEAGEASVTRFSNVLQREFEAFRDRVSGGRLRVERLDWSRRKCKFALSFSTAAQAEHRAGVVINFPADYPEGGRPPTVALAKGSSLDNVRKRRLVRMMKTAARTRAEQGSPCLEEIVREIEKFIGEVKTEDAADEVNEIASSMSLVYPSNLLESGAPMLFGDVAVPFPRTSGASFGGNGRLVCFGRVASQAVVPDGGTPRTLANFYAWMTASQSPMATVTAAASAVNSGVDKKSDSLKRKGRFNIKKVATGSGDISAMNRKTSWPGSAQGSRRSRFSSEHRQEKPGRVAVYSVERLFPFSRARAEQYDMHCRDRVESCRANVVVALRTGSSAAARHWSLGCLVAELLERHGAGSDLFRHHTLGRKMLVSLLDHAVSQGDVQLAATMACVFAAKRPSPPQPPVRPVLRKLPPLPPSLGADKRVSRKKRLRKGGRGRRQREARRQLRELSVPDRGAADAATVCGEEARVLVPRRRRLGDALHLPLLFLPQPVPHRQPGLARRQAETGESSAAGPRRGLLQRRVRRRRRELCHALPAGQQVQLLDHRDGGGVGDGDDGNAGPSV